MTTVLRFGEGLVPVILVMVTMTENKLYATMEPLTAVTHDDPL